MSEAENTTPAPETRELIFELAERRVSFTLDEDLYPRDAIYGAAYLFVDRCYIFLDKPTDRQVEVRLRTKPGTDADEAALEALAGEFANELLNQVLRVRIGNSTARLREYYLARAFFHNQSDTSAIDALLAELDDEELADDDLEIAVPWQEDGTEGSAP